MKIKHNLKNILVFGMLCFVALAYSQDYLNETCKWKIKDLAFVDFAYFNTDYQDYIEGDTIINNLTYFKVYRKGRSISGFTPTDSMFVNEFHQYEGAILEEDRKWYWIEKETNESTLLFDFDVVEGDSIHYLGSDTKYELQLIDSIFLGGSFKKVYKLGALPINLIEGVGWNTGFISPLFNPESFSYLQCFNINGENLNPDLSIFEMILNLEVEEVENCGALFTGINNAKDKYLIANIYPNPFEEAFSIKSEVEIDQVIIVDKLGKIIYSEKWINDKVDLGDLDSGIYYLTLVGRKGLSTYRILKIQN